MSLLQIEGEHIYSAQDGIYKLAGGSGMFLLVLTFLMFTIVSGHLSAKLPAQSAVLLGVGTLGISLVVWKLLKPFVAMDYWTMMLIVPAAICLLGGFVLIVVGTIRLILGRIRPQLR